MLSNMSKPCGITLFGMRWTGRSIFMSGILGTALSISLPLAASTPHEPVEWTWAEFPEHVVPGLPNVLLEGDSITRNYYPEVRKRLEGKANVFLFATSACVGDTRLTEELRSYGALAHTHFSVIHFNNGMHGWGITARQYRSDFPHYLSAIKDLSPKGRLIWTTTTNMRIAVANGGSNARIEERNRIAEAVVRARGVSIDDQNMLMRDQTALYQDDVHFGPVGSERQARQVAEIIARVL